MVSAWDVIVSHEAEKVLRRLDRRQRERLREEIYDLGGNPYPAPGRDMIPVKGVPDLLRLRVGNWRIFYTINDTENTVYVAAMRPRGGALACDSEDKGFRLNSLARRKGIMSG